jgi:hypothetical protein
MPTALEIELVHVLHKISKAYDVKPWGQNGKGASPKVRKMLDRANILLEMWHEGATTPLPH